MADENTKERERDFTMEDSLLIHKSRTLRGLFLQNIAPFTAFDNDLDSTYADNWLTLIEECEGTETDETVMDQSAQNSADLDEAKKEGFTAANDLEYYVKKAFPEKKRIMEEFGFTEKKKARAAQFNQYMWMRVMKKIAEDYLTELNAVNMPASVMSNLETKTQEVLEKETTQEYYKHLRIRFSRLRIERLNKLYKYCTTVNSAAQVVFDDEPEEKALFNIY